MPCRSPTYQSHSRARPAFPTPNPPFPRRRQSKCLRSLPFSRKRAIFMLTCVRKATVIPTSLPSSPRRRESKAMRFQTEYVTRPRELKLRPLTFAPCQVCLRISTIHRDVLYGDASFLPGVPAPCGFPCMYGANAVGTVLALPFRVRQFCLGGSNATLRHTMSQFSGGCLTVSNTSRSHETRPGYWQPACIGAGFAPMYPSGQM